MSMKFINMRVNEEQLRYLRNVVDKDLSITRGNLFVATGEDAKKIYRQREARGKQMQTKIVKCLMKMMLDENTIDAESED